MGEIAGHQNFQCTNHSLRVIGLGFVLGYIMFYPRFLEELIQPFVFIFTAFVGSNFLWLSSTAEYCFKPIDH